VAILKGEGIDVSSHRPQHVTTDELQTAERIVSMGCTADELSISPARVEQWSDIPPVSQNPEDAREAIRTHIETLVAELQRG